MAHTAHKTADEIKEHFDTDEQVEQKAEELAQLIKKSKRTCASMQHLRWCDLRNCKGFFAKTSPFF